MIVHAALPRTRAFVFALVCTALGASGHWLASGHRPPVFPLLVAAGLVYVLAKPLTGRQRSLAEITAAVFVAQVCLHMVFALVRFSAVPSAHTPAGPAGSPVHSPVHEAATVESHPGPMPPGTMVLAHLAAGFAAGWWLRRGEAMAWALCTWLAALVADPLRGLFALLALAGCGPALPGKRCVPGVSSAPAIASGLLTRHTISRRGPPVHRGMC
jgi:hypothetical protein